MEKASKISLIVHDLIFGMFQLFYISLVMEWKGVIKIERGEGNEDRGRIDGRAFFSPLSRI